MSEKDQAAVALGKKRWTGTTAEERQEFMAAARKKSIRKLTAKARRENGRKGGLKASANKRARLAQENPTPLSGG